MTDPAAGSFFDPAILANPYPLYAKLREDAPVFWFAPAQSWLLTRYADIVSILKDTHRFSSNRVQQILDSQVGEAQREAFSAFVRVASKWLFVLDPPDHTRIRNLVSRAFTPATVERTRSHAQAIVTELLDKVQPAGRMDVVADLAFPTAALVIARMLGAPDEDCPKFLPWSTDLGIFIGIAPPEADAARRAQRSLEEMVDYFKHLIALRRSDPRNDLMSKLIAAEDQGNILDEDELYATCILLLSAGHETTQNLIGNGLLLLLQHPEERQKLVRAPSLIKTAVDEMLRYEPPVQCFGRIAKEDIVLRGQTIKRGQHVLASFAAANRDPERFEQPEVFDITRADNPHLSFGYGIHFCPGSTLGRMEAQIVITEVLRRMPNIELESETLDWHAANLMLRGLKTFPVKF
ncbi:cytochrome P450 [Polyangium aurulentum]|uniref:cytochrome P450 n=1 Tax=Polyangium aurulentum TaxID=2567896 RepID=UPI0010ADFADC|nr:cytochrome P450 [Polyangium aurulentum]UQA61062.1 cytochrome P450 [Polyangium aurulentum]